jgi:hypothetical protein
MRSQVIHEAVQFSFTGVCHGPEIHSRGIPMREMIAVPLGDWGAINTPHPSKREVLQGAGDRAPGETSQCRSVYRRPRLCGFGEDYGSRRRMAT